MTVPWDSHWDMVEKDGTRSAGALDDGDAVTGVEQPCARLVEQAVQRPELTVRSRTTMRKPSVAGRHELPKALLKL